VITYGSEVIVDRPHAEVAAYIVDPATHQAWMGDVAGIEPLTPGNAGVGSRYRYVIKKGPMSISLTMRIAALSDREVAYQTEPGGTLDWQARITFEPIDAMHTRVGSTGTMGMRGIRRLLEPLMAGEVRSGEAAELTTLKRVLESRPIAQDAVTPGA
jgi:hypothetical protein